MSTEASAAEIIIIMNGKLTHTLKMHDGDRGQGRVGQEQHSPMPSARARLGTGLSGVATSQFQAVEDTTIGTTQGSSSNTLNRCCRGSWCAAATPSPRPISQEPNTPTMVNTSVNRAAFQNDSAVRTSTIVLEADELAGDDQGARCAGTG